MVIPISEFEKHSDGVIAEVIKETGEVAISLTIDFNLDEVRPKVSIHESVILASNAAAFLLSGTCSASGENVDISGDASFSAPCEHGTWKKVLDASSFAEGSLTFIAKHKNAHLWPAVPVIRNILKDTVIPTLAFDAAPNINIGNASNYSVSGTCSESGESVSVTGVTNTTVKCMGGVFSISINTNAINDGGTGNLTAMIVDKAGNDSNPAHVILTKDITAPVVTIDASSAINSANQANYLLSGACSEEDRIVTLSGAFNATAPCNLGLWSLAHNFTALADGNVTINLVQDDAAGNVSAQASHTILKLTTAPIFTSLLGANEAADGYINAAEKDLTNAIVALTASNYITVHYSPVLDDTSSITCDDSKTYSSTMPPAIDATPSADGSYAVCVRLSDEAGNTTYGKSQTIVRDIVPPVFGSLAAANEAADSYINGSETSSTSAFATLTGSSGYVTAEYTNILDNNPPVLCDAAKTYSNSSIPAISTIPASDGYYALCVRLIDAAGNITYGKSSSVMRDTEAPIFTSLALANQATDEVINNADIALNNALVSAVSGSGFTASHYKVTLGVTACSDETYVSTTLPKAGSMTAGTHKVCVRLQDTAGNITYGNSNDIVVDTTNPTVDLGFDQAHSAEFTPWVSTGGASTFQWSVTAGTAANITFGTPTSYATTISASTPGEYRLRLTVTRPSGNTAYDEMYLYWLPASGAHTGFVTMSVFQGGLGGLIGADAKCNYDAALGGLSGSYKALISTSAVDANSRIVTSFPILRRDGVKIADDSADMWDGSLDNGFSKDVIGRSLSDVRPWTGSTNLGVHEAGKSCTDWTVSAGGGANMTAQGYATSNTYYWFGDVYSSPCNNYYPLYCISEAPESVVHFTGTASKVGASTDITFVIPLPVTGVNGAELRRAEDGIAPPCNGGTLVRSWSGTAILMGGSRLRYTDTGSASTAYSYTMCLKTGATVLRSYALTNITSSAMKHVAFSTMTQYAPGDLGGLTGADAKCQERADAVQLGGTYKAILSSDTEDAASRITISGPVYNTAGQLVANDAADLWDGTIAASLVYSETGLFWGPTVVTGSTAAGTKTGDTCSNWTSTTGTARYGLSSATTSDWISFNEDSCEMVRALYCISQ